MEALSVRRISAHPAGGVIVATCGPNAIDATMTSNSAVPAGLLMVRVSAPNPAAAWEAERNAVPRLAVNELTPRMSSPT